MLGLSAFAVIVWLLLLALFASSLSPVEMRLASAAMAALWLLLLVAVNVAEMSVRRDWKARGLKRALRRRRRKAS